MRKYFWTGGLAVITLLCALAEGLFTSLPAGFVQATGVLTIITPLALLAVALKSRTAAR